MEASPWLIGILLCAVLMVLNAPPPGDFYDVDVRELAGLWENERVSPPDMYALKPAGLKRQLQEMVHRHPGVLNMETAGSSVEGREIFLVTAGTGPNKILLWSQMHGDEPTATCSLLDILNFFGLHQQEGWVKQILQKYTLLCIPMLNPDGAEHGQRRNAQGIDINRDARLLQTPEGRLLKTVQDRYHPFLGFNLHNQNSLTTVGDTGRVATIALLAVAAEAPLSPEMPPGNEIMGARILTKQITAVLYDALSNFVYGHVSRYDESFNPRAFGDNLTLWGTPIVLIESGGNPAGQPPDFAVKLNYVCLLAALNSLATGKIANANPAVYDSLKMNSDVPIFDLMLRNAWIFTGTGVPPFKGDVAIRRDSRAGAGGDSIIADLGDLGVYSAHETIDCTSALVTPGLIAWDPQSSPLSGSSDDQVYLRKGISTVLQTISGKEIVDKRLSLDREQADRGINWGFIILGEPPGDSAGEALHIADWLAAGGRGWIIPGDAHVPAEAKRIPSWFGVDVVSPAVADGYRVPPSLEGEPGKVLPRWMSEAARQFHIRQRGILTPGAIADLVIWKSSSGGPPTDLRDLKPAQVLINGKSGLQPLGRFLGR